MCFPYFSLSIFFDRQIGISSTAPRWPSSDAPWEIWIWVLPWVHGAFWTRPTGLSMESMDDIWTICGLYMDYNHVDYIWFFSAFRLMWLMFLYVSVIYPSAIVQIAAESAERLSDHSFQRWALARCDAPHTFQVWWCLMYFIYIYIYIFIVHFQRIIPCRFVCFNSPFPDFVWLQDAAPYL